MTVQWCDWYMGSLEAGRPLSARAEIVDFARKAKQHLHENQVEVIAVEQPIPNCRNNPLNTRIKDHGARKTLHADELVDLFLKGSAFTFHAAKSLTRWRPA